MGSHPRKMLINMHSKFCMQCKGFIGLMKVKDPSKYTKTLT